jgi:hypothetical protein
MEELGLDFDNILDDDEMSNLLFDDTAQDNNDETLPDDKEDKENKDTAEVDPDHLFYNEEDDEGIPENVGGDKSKQGKKEDTTANNSGTSPDFFSSIATAFAEEGIFPDLDEDTIKGITDAESFRGAINEQIKAGLTEQQKRVSEALDNGVEPDQIKYHENLIGWLNAQDDNIEVEGDAGDNLRRRVIMQDYLNKGFKEERAKVKVDKIFEEGSEIDEAKDSLQSLKAYYTSNYKKLCDDAKAEADKEVEERKQKAARIKKSIVDDKIKLFGDIDLSKEIRQAAFDAISKPIYKDPATGESYTAVQKLELDNSEEFMAKMGLLYVLTDGLTSIKGLVDKKVKRK